MKTIMITGASRGIGKACGLAFAKEGVHLILVCKENKKELEATAAKAAALGAVCETHTADLSSPAAVRNLFQTLTDKKISIDLLINNAGISHVGLLQDLSDLEWHTILDTNLSSVFYCCREVIPMMLHSGAGRIINLSSIWGSKGASCEVAYSASKGGVETFTKALAKELAPSNIQVNAVSCGMVDTQMNSHLTQTEVQDFADNYVAAGRISTPEEVAAFIRRIAEAENYLTGQIIGFDGGF